jgi:hypothetical protein
MCRALVVLPLALVLVAPDSGVAQPVESFLALRIKSGDSLRIETPSGERLTGRLTRLEPTEIAIRTDSGERRLTGADVREIGVRRQRRLVGTLVGAAVGAALGALADCGGGENDTCDLDMPILLGAGVGFGVGAAVHKTTIVYPERGKRVFLAPSFTRGAIGLRAGLRW